jgi:MFS transporter, ACS family, D-galactonate transporter
VTPFSDTSLPQEPVPRLSPELRRVATLLAFSIFINYLDRGALSIAAPLLKEDLRFSPAQLGVLLSSFFWT